MSTSIQPAIGSLVWHDLTVPDAGAIRDFYQSVIGWAASPEDMGGYDDYHLCLPHSGESVAGICHARDTNANLPPQWLIYITVADVVASAARCVDLGGAVVDGPRPMGKELLFCVIRDPAGAVIALMGPNVTDSGA